MKKPFSVLMVFLLLLGLMPAAAFAQEAGEEPLTKAVFFQLAVDELGLQYDESMAIELTDVPPDHPNYQAIAIAYHFGWSGATASSTFYPDKNVTRADSATILYSAGLPASAPETMPSDVNSDGWYYEPIAAVLDAGVMQADAGGLFHPFDTAYASDINWQMFRSFFSATTTAPVQMDLSNGSIEISENIMGMTVVTQGDTVIRTEDQNIVVRQSNPMPTTNTVTLSKGNLTLTLAGVHIDTGSNEHAISIRENAALALNLVGDNITTGGIRVSENAGLTIDGMGTLVTEGYSESYSGSAGITNSGTVTINGGTVTATGGNRSAGIGGGNYDGNGGIVTINGGTVTATGGDYGAGIGGGRGGDGGTVTITGGIVTATGNGGAGIGGGYHGDGGTVTINGGTVTATGGSFGAGIGGGGYNGNGGTVTITGGTVTATGGISGAGIGGGYGGNGGTVTITGGDVMATGEYAAIGGGYNSNEYGCNSITIGEDAKLTLKHTYSKGFDFQERIFDLELPQWTAAHGGHAFRLSATARSHSGIASYQWQTCAANSENDSDWTDVEGQTAADYTAPMTAEQEGHYFRCKITNVYGNVAYTGAAQGFVLAFKNQPQSVDTGLNQTVSLNATATCPNVSYRWQRSYDEGETWAAVPGENYSTLLVSTARSENGALYRCIITASNGDELASDSARINIATGEQTYTVRYYQQNADGSGYTVASQDVLPGTVGQTVTAPAKTFDGFTENVSKGTASGTVTGTGLILSRYFDRNTYEITFDMGGGPAIAPLSARYGAAVQAPDTPGRYGYTFAGWFADSALTQAYEFTAMPLNGATVYARWLPIGLDRGIEYRIQEIVLRDTATYQPLDKIPARDFLAEVTVTNLSSTQTDTVLLAAYDKNGKLLGMSYLYANPKIGQTVTLGTRVQNSGQVSRVKAMVLPNLANPVPLANTAERT